MTPPIPPQTSLQTFLWLLIFFFSGVIGTQLNGRTEIDPDCISDKRMLIEYLLNLAKHDVISGIMGIIAGIITYGFTVEQVGNQPNIMLLILVGACMSSPILLKYVKNTVTVFINGIVTTLISQALQKASGITPDKNKSEDMKDES